MGYTPSAPSLRLHTPVYCIRRYMNNMHNSAGTHWRMWTTCALADSSGDLSESEGCTVLCPGQQAAIDQVRLAVGYVVLPAVAGRASHDQQRAGREQQGKSLPLLPELHHCLPCQRQRGNSSCGRTEFAVSSMHATSASKCRACTLYAHCLTCICMPQCTATVASDMDCNMRVIVCDIQAQLRC